MQALLENSENVHCPLSFDNLLKQLFLLLLVPIHAPPLTTFIHHTKKDTAYKNLPKNKARNRIKFNNNMLKSNLTLT